MSEDTRRPCNCGNPTNTIGNPIIPGTVIGRTVLGDDFRYINGELIIHTGYKGGRASQRQSEGIDERLLRGFTSTRQLPTSSTRDLLTELREIDSYNSELLTSSRQDGSSTGIQFSYPTDTVNYDNINPKSNSDDSIIKSITINGESNSVGIIPDWDANKWQNNNINVPNGSWLSPETPYVFNFGKFDQFGRTISVKDIKNKDGKIIWAITIDGEIINQSIKLTIDYIIDYYGGGMKSIAELDLIDIGNTIASFSTNLSCKKTIKDNKNKSNVVTVQYDISWNPILETMTDKSVDLKQLIIRLSNYKDKSSADKLSRIMEEINQSINNTKLSLYIRYGPDKDKLSGIGSLLAINIQNN